MRLTIKDIEAARGDYEPFEIELEDGSLLTLPHPKQMKSAALINSNGASTPEDFALHMLAASNEFSQFIEREDGTLEDIDFVMEAYTAHFDLGTPGEGSASRPSSNGSARQSKPTSQRKGKR